ncbi:MAG: PQQ-dependent sugar dehydrogenase [Phycisphaerae bacterium]|nr:PQQ-dependent sugar dehydrogenase [Phycisphaerae bacterium]
MLIMSALVAATAAPALAQTTLPIKTKRIVATGLTFPTRIAFAPGDDNNMYILEKAGRIRRFDLTTNTLQTANVLNIDPIVVGGTSVSDEQGLLGIVFHPDYPNTPYIYVNYTATAGAGDTVVARYTMTDATTADPASALPIITYDQPFANHNGGWLGFGPDGYLYISAGDGGSGNDPGNRAQDITDQKLGKILRVDVNGDDFPADATKNYAIPPSNPFAGPTVGDDEILHYGVRNPWSCSFDRQTGDLWIGDVGQNAWEEISFAPAGSTGLNFGWRCTEGNNCTGLGGCTCGALTLTPPVHVYDHGATGGSSVTGGIMYRGCEIPEAQGVYFFADYGSGRFWSFRYDNGVKTLFTVQTPKFTPSLDGTTVNQIVAFAQNNAGELYMSDHGGQIYRMVRDPNAAVLPDCDGNGISDSCEIAAGAPDTNGNGVPDACEAVPGDIDGDGIVNGADLGILLGSWGKCTAPCAADLTGDGIVDGGDLGSLLGFWSV